MDYKGAFYEYVYMQPGAQGRVKGIYWSTPTLLAIDSLEIPMENLVDGIIQECIEELWEEWKLDPFVPMETN